MSNYLKSLIQPKDIVPNLIETFPSEFKNKLFGEEEFYSYLVKNQYNCVCYHITRLTENELIDIKNNGIKFGNKEFLISRINNLPSDYKEIKEFLLKNIEVEFSNESDENNLVFAFYGRLDLKNNIADNNSFFNNWGGEAIYRYIDRNDNFSDPFLRRTHEKLQRISKPYLIVLRTSENISLITQSGNIYKDYVSSNTNNSFGSFALTEIPETIKTIELTDEKIMIKDRLFK